MAGEIDCAKQKQITSGASCSWAFTILKLLHNHTQNRRYISTLKITDESPQRLGRSLDVTVFPKKKKKKRSIAGLHYSLLLPILIIPQTTPKMSLTSEGI
jgi:hypothetical protein